MCSRVAEGDIAPDLGSGGTLVSGGAMLRLALLWRWVGATIGIEVPSGSDQRFAMADAHLQRVPLDAGVRLALRRGRIALAGDLGLAVAVLLVEGQKLDRAEQSTRVDVGARLGAELAVWVAPRLALVLAPAVVASFQPSVESVDSDHTVVGRTPPVWVGVQLGLTGRLR
jgi:hypothetical protein